MSVFGNKARSRKSQAGASLIEVLIAAVVFTVCILGVVPLFMVAIGNNGRSKLDTTSTELAQSVIEQIVAVKARGGPAQMIDCAPTPKTWLISVDNTPAGQVPLNADNSAIDFTAATVNGYHMDFSVCGDSPTTGAVYDVRWRIDEMPINTSLVTVSARPKSMPTQRFAFSLPVTMRTYVGPQ